MTEHTPGPWRLTKFAYSDAWSVVAKHPAVGHLPRATGDICLATPAPHFDADEQEANARLIAEAPAMLDTLREAMRSVDWFRRIALEGEENPREFDPAAWDEMRTQQRRARAIIARVEAPSLSDERAGS